MEAVISRMKTVKGKLKAASKRTQMIRSTILILLHPFKHESEYDYLKLYLNIIIYNYIVSITEI